MPPLSDWALSLAELPSVPDDKVNTLLQLCGLQPGGGRAGVATRECRLFRA